MEKVSVYNNKGEQVGEVKLSSDVFGVAHNDALIHQVYTSINSNKRQVIAHAKDRSERKGSGRKPFKQKGTGNARSGTRRNPLWRKGGVIFGPNKDRNFKKKVNVKMRKKAMLIALSDKVRSKELFIVEKLELKDKKTKEFAKIIKNLKLDKNTLVGFSENEMELRRYCSNISNAQPTLVKNFNVFDILNNRYLLISKESVKILEKMHSSKEDKTK